MAWKSSFAYNVEAEEAYHEADMRKREAAEARQRRRSNRFKRKPGFPDLPLRSPSHIEPDPAPATGFDIILEVMKRHAEAERNFTILKGDLKEDHYLTLNYLIRSYGAVAFLNCKGKMFNVMYTCTWESMYAGNCSDAKVDAAIKKHIKHIYKWFKYRGEEFFYMWFVERGKKRGLHFHCLLHVPEGLIPGLKQEVEQSVFTIYGRRARRPGKRGKLASLFLPVDDTKTVDFQINSTVDDQWRRWRYCFEGIDKHLSVNYVDQPSWKPEPIRSYLKLEKMSYQGRYTKQRFGWSSTLLGQKARRAFDKKYGRYQKMPNSLLPTVNSDELYGSQYLDWSRMNMCEDKLLLSLEI